jgi:hypothetical protein
MQADTSITTTAIILGESIPLRIESLIKSWLAEMDLRRSELVLRLG